jgi:hypothetical protein
MLQDQRIIEKLDELTKGFTKDDIALLMQVLKNNEGNEIEILQDLMGYTYRWPPVGTREFIESPQYLGLEGQVFPRLLDDLEELFEGDYVEAVLTGAIGWGKCQDGFSKVPTSTGVKRLKDIEVGDLVMSVAPNGSYKLARVAALSTTRKNCNKYTFSRGLQLKCSVDHPVLTQRGWVSIGEVTKEDFVASSKHVVGCQDFDEDLAKWFACMAAELPVSNGNNDIVPVGYEELKQLCSLVGGLPKEVWNTIQVTKGQYLGRKCAQKIFDLYADVLPDQWKLWLNPNISWERLESVESLGEMDLYDIDVPETRNFIANGMIVHNSTFAEIAMCRMLYEISCLRDPQRVYGLMQGSVIVLLNVGITLDNAKKIVFQGVKNKLHASPYFVEKFPYGAWQSELRFPNNIWVFPAVAGSSGVIGYNVFGGVMDEVNFMSVVENSKAKGASNGRYDQADTLHKSLIRRMKSRFMKKGKLPGILLQISSSRYPEDFTERRLKDAEEDPTIFTRRYAQWDTLPADRWSGKKFWVALGDGIEPPRILKDDEEKRQVEEKKLPMIEVPIEFYRDFDKDIDAAIRDFAGRPTLTIRPFIRYRNKVVEALAKGAEIGLEHPYSKTETTLQDGGIFLVDKLRIPHIKKQLETAVEPEKRKLEEELRFLKSKPRFVHVDLSYASDSTGLAMGYVQGYKEVIRRNEAGEQFSAKMPIIVIEFMIRIRPPKGGEIQFADVRSLIYELKSYGYPIRKVTFDSFQSKDSMQQFQQKGIESGHVSADTNPAVYNAYRDALYEDRLITYQYDILLEETIRLEKNEKKNKVDHPANGSKDVADAVAGVCYDCVTEGMIAPAPPPSLGEMEGGEIKIQMERSADDADLFGYGAIM